MSAKHTPGPWTIDTGVRTSINAGTKHIALANFYNSIEPEFNVSGDEHEANARLIAAAPDMADALKEAERFMSYFAGETDLTFEGPGTPKSCLAIIRAALSKAEAT